MIFNFTSVIYWRVITAKKQRQFDIDSVHENAKWVTIDYAVRGIVYVGMTGIYQKLDYDKQGTYIITKVLTKGTVQVQQGKVNKPINITRCMPQLR